MKGSGARARIIINARSGAALGLSSDTMMRRTHEIFEAAGCGADVQIAAPQSIDSLIAEARRRDQPIIIGGGDGTVRAAAAQLIDTGIPLGIIPLGTMNLLAREIDMPLGFDAAVAALAGGEPLSIDAASVNGDVFLCNSLMGLPAIFSRHRETMRGAGLLDGIGKAWTLTRRIAALRHRIGVELDDGTGVHRGRVMAIAVSNNLYDGTNAVGLRRPRLDGGKLGAYMSQHRTGPSATIALMKAYLGTWRGDPYISERCAHTIRITSRQRRIWLSNDGETKAYRTPLIYRCHPGAISLIVPREHLRARMDLKAWSTIAISGAGQAGSWLAVASSTL